MVVKHLQTYIEEKIPEALYSANLRDLIKNEVLNTGRRPTIVLDESATFSVFDENGQPSVLKKNIENFVDNIISCGADLVVILRGNLDCDIPLWYRKVMNFGRDEKKLLMFSEKGVLEHEFFKQFEFICTKMCMYVTFSCISKNHYKVFVSVKSTHKEVANIAGTENCLAVIGQDSNYIIYEGIRYYILTKSLDILTLNCRICDRNKLIQYFDLQSYQLPLFATLCGNNIVDANDLYNFHKKISSSNPDKLLGIAKIIRSTTQDPYKHAKYVADLINHPSIDESVIKQSLDLYLQYSEYFTDNKLEAFAIERKRSYEWSGTIYSIFTTKQFRGSSYPGPFSSNLLSSDTYLRPLRKKVYGILFYEGEVRFVDEYCLEEIKRHKKKMPVPYRVFIEKTKCEHPGLIQLWVKHTPNLNFLKWNLFCSSIGRNLNYPIVKSIPPRLLIPVLALHYLAVEVPLYFGKAVFKEKFELETFLLVALLATRNRLKVENRELNEWDLRVSNLIFIFLDTCYTLNLLNETCGLVLPKEQTCICNYYDGILVHYVYKKMEKGAKRNEFFVENEALGLVFRTLLKIILSEGD